MKRALLLIDVQNDFCEGGGLAVPEGSKIIPIINDLRKRVSFDMVVLSQDWHPKDHISFASNNKGSTVFTVVNIDGVGEQMMWPDHCIQGSSGAEFHKDLHREPTDVVVQKGTNKMVDSYSAFYDNNKLQKTEMTEVLKKAGITDCVLCGLATDYCVGFSALDCKSEGFNTTFLEDCSRGIDPSGIENMIKKLQGEGIQICKSTDIQ